MTPALFFCSGRIFRNLTENVILVVIRINYRPNICIGNFKLMAVFPDCPRYVFCFLMGLVLKMLENMFLLEILLESGNILSVLPCVCVYIFG